MLDSNVKKARLTPHRPSEKAAVTPLFLFSGYSFRISLWKGASEKGIDIPRYQASGHKLQSSLRDRERNVCVGRLPEVFSMRVSGFLFNFLGK